MEKIKKKRMFYFFTFLASLIVFITLAILTWVLFDLSDDIKLSIILVLSIIFLGVALWYRPRIVYYATIYQWLRLKENKEQIKKTNINLSLPSFVKKITDEKFKPYKDNEILFIAYRYIKDSKTLAIKRGSLEVFVLLKDSNISFNDPIVSKTINEIEEKLGQEKKRFASYVVFQISLVDEITDELIDKADQIAFDKHGFLRVAILNVLYNKKNSNLYYLKNNSYSPNYHFQYAMDLLESFIL